MLQVRIDRLLSDFEWLSRPPEVRWFEANRQWMIVFALTAISLCEDRERYLADGTNNHFNKPILKEKLEHKLTDWSKSLESDLSKQKWVNLTIDWEHLHQISDGNEDFERELLQIFVEDVRNHLEEAQAALLIGDHGVVSRAAHHVKGASANVGLKEMQAIASLLETNAYTKQSSESAVMLAELANLLQDVQAFLSQE